MAGAEAVDYALAAAILHETGRQTAAASAIGVAEELMNWSSAAPLGSFYSFAADGEKLTVDIRPDKAGLTASVGEARFAISALEVGETTARATIDGHRVSAAFVAGEDAIQLTLPRKDLALTLHRPAGAAGGAGGGGQVTAPMHGVLLEVLVTEGEAIAAGQKLAILEAMKMQHEILATIDGRVTSITGAAGAQMAAGDLIIEIEGEDA